MSSWCHSRMHWSGPPDEETPHSVKRRPKVGKLVRWSLSSDDQACRTPSGNIKGTQDPHHNPALQPQFYQNRGGNSIHNGQQGSHHEPHLAFHVPQGSCHHQSQCPHGHSRNTQWPSHSTHPPSTPYQNVAHTHASSTPYQNAAHTHPSSTSYQNTSHTHPSYTPYQNTSHSHPTSTHYQNAAHTHPTNTPYKHARHAHPSSNPYKNASRGDNRYNFGAFNEKPFRGNKSVSRTPSPRMSRRPPHKPLAGVHKSQERLVTQSRDSMSPHIRLSLETVLPASARDSRSSGHQMANNISRTPQFSETTLSHQRKYAQDSPTSAPVQYPSPYHSNGVERSSYSSNKSSPYSNQRGATNYTSTSNRRLRSASPTRRSASANKSSSYASFNSSPKKSYDSHPHTNDVSNEQSEHKETMNRSRTRRETLSSSRTKENLIEDHKKLIRNARLKLATLMLDETKKSNHEMLQAHEMKKRDLFNSCQNDQNSSRTENLNPEFFRKAKSNETTSADKCMKSYQSIPNFVPTQYPDPDVFRNEKLNESTNRYVTSYQRVMDVAQTQGPKSDFFKNQNPNEPMKKCVNSYQKTQDYVPTKSGNPESFQNEKSTERYDVYAKSYHKPQNFVSTQNPNPKYFTCDNSDNREKRGICGKPYQRDQSWFSPPNPNPEYLRNERLKSATDMCMNSYQTAQNFDPTQSLNSEWLKNKRPDETKDMRMKSFEKPHTFVPTQNPKAENFGNGRSKELKDKYLNPYHKPQEFVQTQNSSTENFRNAKNKDIKDMCVKTYQKDGNGFSTQSPNSEYFKTKKPREPKPVYVKSYQKTQNYVTAPNSKPKLLEKAKSPEPKTKHTKVYDEGQKSSLIPEFSGKKRMNEMKKRNIKQLEKNQKRGPMEDSFAQPMMAGVIANNIYPEEIHHPSPKCNDDKTSSSENLEFISYTTAQNAHGVPKRQETRDQNTLVLTDMPPKHDSFEKRRKRLLSHSQVHATASRETPQNLAKVTGFDFQRESKISQESRKGEKIETDVNEANKEYDDDDDDDGGNNDVDDNDDDENNDDDGKISKDKIEDNSSSIMNDISRGRQTDRPLDPHREITGYLDNAITTVENKQHDHDRRTQSKTRKSTCLQDNTNVFCSETEKARTDLFCLESETTDMSCNISHSSGVKDAVLKKQFRSDHVSRQAHGEPTRNTVQQSPEQIHNIQTFLNKNKLESPCVSFDLYDHNIAANIMDQDRYYQSSPRSVLTTRSEESLQSAGFSSMSYGHTVRETLSQQDLIYQTLSDSWHRTSEPQRRKLTRSHARTNSVSPIHYLNHGISKVSSDSTLYSHPTRRRPNTTHHSRKSSPPHRRKEYHRIVHIPDRSVSHDQISKRMSPDRKIWCNPWNISINKIIKAHESTSLIMHKGHVKKTKHSTREMGASASYGDRYFSSTPSSWRRKVMFKDNHNESSGRKRHEFRRTKKSQHKNKCQSASLNEPPYDLNENGISTNIDRGNTMTPSATFHIKTVSGQNHVNITKRHVSQNLSENLANVLQFSSNKAFQYANAVNSDEYRCADRCIRFTQNPQNLQSTQEFSGAMSTVSKVTPRKKGNSSGEEKIYRKNETIEQYKTRNNRIFKAPATCLLNPSLDQCKGAMQRIIKKSRETKQDQTNFETKSNVTFHCNVPNVHFAGKHIPATRTRDTTTKLRQLQWTKHRHIQSHCQWRMNNKDQGMNIHDCSLELKKLIQETDKSTSQNAITIKAWKNPSHYHIPQPDHTETPNLSDIQRNDNCTAARGGNESQNANEKQVTLKIPIRKSHYKNIFVGTHNVRNIRRSRTITRLSSPKAASTKASTKYSESKHQRHIRTRINKSQLTMNECTDMSRLSDAIGVSKSEKTMAVKHNALQASNVHIYQNVSTSTLDKSSIPTDSGTSNFGKGYACISPRSFSFKAVCLINEDRPLVPKNHKMFRKKLAVVMPQPRITKPNEQEKQMSSNEDYNFTNSTERSTNRHDGISSFGAATTSSIAKLELQTDSLTELPEGYHSCGRQRRKASEKSVGNFLPYQERMLANDTTFHKHWFRSAFHGKNKAFERISVSPYVCNTTRSLKNEQSRRISRHRCSIDRTRKPMSPYRPKVRSSGSSSSYISDVSSRSMNRPRCCSSSLTSSISNAYNRKKRSNVVQYALQQRMAHNTFKPLNDQVLINKSTSVSETRLQLHQNIETDANKPKSKEIMKSENIHRVTSGDPAENPTQRTILNDRVYFSSKNRLVLQDTHDPINILEDGDIKCCKTKPSFVTDSRNKKSHSRQSHLCSDHEPPMYHNVNDPHPIQISTESGNKKQGKTVCHSKIPIPIKKTSNRLSSSYVSKYQNTEDVMAHSNRSTLQLKPDNCLGCDFTNFLCTQPRKSKQRGSLHKETDDDKLPVSKSPKCFHIRPSASQMHPAQTQHTRIRPECYKPVSNQLKTRAMDLTVQRSPNMPYVRTHDNLLHGVSSSPSLCKDEIKAVECHKHCIVCPTKNQHLGRQMKPHEKHYTPKRPLGEDSHFEYTEISAGFKECALHKPFEPIKRTIVPNHLNQRNNDALLPLQLIDKAVFETVADEESNGTQTVLEMDDAHTLYSNSDTDFKTALTLNCKSRKYENARLSGQRPHTEQSENMFPLTCADVGDTELIPTVHDQRGERIKDRQRKQRDNLMHCLTLITQILYGGTGEGDVISPKQISMKCNQINKCLKKEISKESSPASLFHKSNHETQQETQKHTTKKYSVQQASKSSSVIRSKQTYEHKNMPQATREKRYVSQECKHRSDSIDYGGPKEHGQPRFSSSTFIKSKETSPKQLPKIPAPRPNDRAPTRKKLNLTATKTKHVCSPEFTSKMISAFKKQGADKHKFLLTSPIQNKSFQNAIDNSKTEYIDESCNPNSPNISIDKERAYENVRLVEANCLLTSSPENCSPVANTESMLQKDFGKTHTISSLPQNNVYESDASDIIGNQMELLESIFPTDLVTQESDTSFNDFRH